MSNRRKSGAERRERWTWRENRHDLHLDCGCVPRWLELVDGGVCPHCGHSPVGDGLAMPIENTPIGGEVHLEVMCQCGAEFSVRAVVQGL